jgi:hypothetical protein
MHWTYPDLLALPIEVYDVLVENINEDARERERETAWR